MKPLSIKGKVIIRSSKGDAGGPPGEAALLKCNPRRRERIMAETGWPDVFPGSLNLSVTRDYLHGLLMCEPALYEDAADIKYPDGSTSIQDRRVGYLYYRGMASNATKGRCDCLVRRAVAPGPRVVELYAPHRIMDTLGVNPGDTVRVSVPRKREAASGQDVPVFWTAAGAGVPSMEGLYRGGHAFLIVNGPSFKAIDRGPLKYVITMCVNNGPAALTPKLRPTFWTCVDSPSKFLHTIFMDPTITKLLPAGFHKKTLWDNSAKAAAGLCVGQCPNVFYYRRNEQWSAERFLAERTVNWGSHSKHADANGVKGKRSVMLAALKCLYVLGFREIYLLGCDFRMEEGQENYAFKQARHSGSISGNNSTYRQLQWRFEQARPIWDAAGFHVYNCNPTSGLTAFPFLDYSEALQRALSFAGPDYRRYIMGRYENTEYLYESRWFECPQCHADFRLASADFVDGKHACSCGFVLTKTDRKKYQKDEIEDWE